MKSEMSDATKVTWNELTHVVESVSDELKSNEIGEKRDDERSKVGAERVDGRSKLVETADLVKLLQLGSKDPTESVKKDQTGMEG